MSKRFVASLALACIAMVAATVAYAGNRVVPTNKLYTTMTGAQEVPGPGDANANGVAIVTLMPDSDQVCVNVRFARIDGTLSGMHIHKGVKGQSGPVVVDLTGALSAGGVGCGPASDTLTTAIRNAPRAYYLNVHSTPSFAAGAIRGQLMDSDI